jgi:hypothetical protein
MCSACSGDPEDPAEGLPELEEEHESPFWAWWREEAGSRSFGTEEAPAVRGTVPGFREELRPS